MTRLHSSSRCGMFVIMLVVWAAMPAGCASTGSAMSAGDRESIRGAPAEWDRLFNARDITALTAEYADDAISMPYNAATVRGRAAIHKEFEALLAANDCTHETMVDETLMGDGWAIERARYAMTIKPKSGGSEVRETGRHVMCRRKSGEHWLIVWEIWNADTPPQ